MKRFAAFFLAALCLIVPLTAQAQDLSGGTGGLWTTQLKWDRLMMRNNVAASAVPLQTNWTKENTNAFADSSVFRRGVTTLTVYDTTKAYSTSNWPFPPTFGPTVANALLDSTNTPWIIVRVRQDTTSYLFAGSSGNAGADTFRVAAEHSVDGINWFSCSGTPTFRFDANFFTSGQDGLQNVGLVGVEASPGEDMGFVVLKCAPASATTNAIIVNRGLCMAGQFVRFIIGGGLYTGQYAVEVASWKQAN